MALSSSDSSVDELMSQVTENEDDDRLYEAVILSAYAMLDYSASSTKKSRKVPYETGIQWVQKQLRDSDDCYDMFRMRRSVFYNLHDLLVNDYGLKLSNEMCSLEAVGLFLWMCGAPQSVIQAKHIFSHSKETISRKFAEVLDCVTQLAAHNIKPKDPTFAVVHSKLQEHRSWPHFKNCIGAIDGTHIPITVPLSEQVVHINRYEYCSQNVMAVCDFDMRFTFVVAGWPGSAHDTRIWRDTLMKFKEKLPHPPEGVFSLTFFILNSDCYRNKKTCSYSIAPYKGQRYHISEFNNGSQPIGLKEIFNHAHSSLRNIIERAFGVLKMKWRILLNMPSYPMEKQKKIILACMALHNFIRDSNLPDVDFDNILDETYVDGDIGPNSNDVDEGEMGDVRDAIATVLAGY